VARSARQDDPDLDLDPNGPGLVYECATMSARGEPLEIRPGVYVPAEAMQVRATRASGPGGQNVNKVSSKVDLRVDLSRLVGLDPGARRRLDVIVQGRLDADGCLVVVSQRTRDQRQNLEDARDKVRGLVLRALEAPRIRRATRPTRGSVERRIAEKKRRASTKAFRKDDRD
jgi:ribosome-associated protein